MKDVVFCPLCKEYVRLGHACPFETREPAREVIRPTIVQPKERKPWLTELPPPNIDQELKPKRRRVRRRRRAAPGAPRRRTR